MANTKVAGTVKKKRKMPKNIKIQMRVADYSSEVKHPQGESKLNFYFSARLKSSVLINSHV
jgi:hypothetical protein